jgi:hypothetical protein
VTAREATATAPGATADDEITLPERSRLVHIGPHKTGTTAIQAALWNARSELPSQGVRLVGRTRNPSNAVRSVTGQSSPYAVGKPPPIGHWNELVRQIRRAREPRVIVSSEFFAWAKPDAIARIAGDLDPARIRVVVTLRPLARILPSMWQQNVQAGALVPFEDWLADVLNGPTEPASSSFWMLERHDALIARWADVVGWDRVSAVVVDEGDHEWQLRVFERFLGLTPRTLALDPVLVNRSLTLPEAEAVRAFNHAFAAERLPRAVHARTMRFGAAQVMKTRQPAADEPRVALPAWALERAAEIQREIVDAIATSGARVVGDLGRLTDGRPEAAPEQAGHVTIAPDVAASMAIGVLLASGGARRRGMGIGRLQFAEPIELARVSTLQLAAVLVGRTINAIGDAWDRIRRGLARRWSAATGSPRPARDGVAEASEDDPADGSDGLVDLEVARVEDDVRVGG